LTDKNKTEDTERYPRDSDKEHYDRAKTKQELAKELKDISREHNRKSQRD